MVVVFVVVIIGAFAVAFSKLFFFFHIVHANHAIFLFLAVRYEILTDLFVCLLFVSLFVCLFACLFVCLFFVCLTGLGYCYIC